MDAVPALADATGAPILIHLDDRLLWKHTHPDRNPDGYLSDSDMRRIAVADTELTVLHTPGHTPGAISLHAPELGTVFAGDTLFAGSPGRPGARTPTSRRSSVPSATACWSYRPRPWSAPATESRPPSAPRPRTSRSGSTGATERHAPAAEAVSPASRRCRPPVPAPTGTAPSAVYWEGSRGGDQESVLIFFMVRWDSTRRIPGRPVSLPVRKAS
ncbi:MBL fold metallo-hydrolase [Streptomyces sp. NPDC002928]|uniref:MBL fold metallo-hydrolase n=1 Tax=Streptomyces sp. NPDC002928 TaxID=3154440 RepID=UPI0033AB32C1